ncbi:hypothetical protein PC129_g6607 [Phytophthora cactorum]|uniref:Uncharacterized protein n=1 Tax=Phytophthora cactorum TaxID=29920 RepID=A0A329SFV1_9STRA|nr:hypothetical protein Pcac1_g16240 [Phytophthora cactorum]KAG3112172.1 hypothetical protein PI125_g8480 [Phytophthora idaei]KAG2836836.1 hypothetical protein PC112_g5133 [Phytophthora cactorum]KAG2859643.1 hypothetical protein PC113_g8741 [Phytophthora cactorum]KAG2911887.1 hypothetical protein PC114_g9177 [Phytophthora cactorum]
MGPSPRLEEAAEQYNTWNYYNKKRRLRGAAIVEVAAAPARARGCVWNNRVLRLRLRRHRKRVHYSR